MTSDNPEATYDTLEKYGYDMVERARSIESILSQYRDTVKPMHEQFVEPSKKYADIIIPEGGRNVVAISILKHYLKMILEGKEV